MDTHKDSVINRTLWDLNDYPEIIITTVLQRIEFWEQTREVSYFVTHDLLQWLRLKFREVNFLYPLWAKNIRDTEKDARTILITQIVPKCD